MQIKKFEAPTMQEALDTIKRELGPEAIILQTKRNRKGFGLMNQGSVEVTAAVSERSLQKKGLVERRLPDEKLEELRARPASEQVEVYDKAIERVEAKQDSARNASVTRVAQAASQAAAKNQGRSRLFAGATVDRAPKVNAVRYADIDSEQVGGTPNRSHAPVSPRAPTMPVGSTPGLTLEDEVRYLKRMLEELKGTQDTLLTGNASKGKLGESSLFTPALEDAFEQLIMNGLEKRFALQIVRKAGFELGEKAKNPEEVLDQVASEIMQTTQTASVLSGIQARSKSINGLPQPLSGTGPKLIALVGPTGVGKTTTIAKIASEAVLKRGLKVGLINLDGYKVAAFDQLATYAKILNCPFRSATSAEDVRAALGDFQGLDVVLIDTTGRSQRDPVALQELQQMLSAIPGVEAELVLSATTRDAELYDMVSRFGIFKPTGIIASKLDEATLFGSLYNVSQKSKLPITYFTTGQRVPEDIEEATRERMASLIMDL